MATLENHMILPSGPDYDHLQPERTETCVSCQKTGCLVDCCWYTETTIEDDGEGPYLSGDGETLTGANDTKHGWVCSEMCQSQVMYDRAAPFEKEMLREVHDACRVIAELGSAARDLVNDFMPSYVGEDLVKEADRFLEAVADTGKEMPAWCNHD